MMILAQLQASAAAGYPGQGSLEATLSAARLPPGRYAYFLELHIEQGPLLEAEGEAAALLLIL